MPDWRRDSGIMTWRQWLLVIKMLVYMNVPDGMVYRNLFDNLRRVHSFFLDRSYM